MKKREEFLKNQKIQLSRELVQTRKLQRNGLYPKELSMPIGLQFELTSKCNLRCKHCYNMSSPENNTAMTVDDWMRVVDDIIKNGGIFQCILSGGEPLLLGDRLFEIMDPLDKDGTAFILITNGFMVDMKTVKKLGKYKWFWIQVSIDHLFENEHDEFRGRTGSWKRAVNAALMFSNAGLPLRIAHSVTSKSLPYLQNFIEFCYQLGASSVICGEVFLSGRVAENKYLLMTDEEFEEMYRVIDEMREKYKGRMTVYNSASENTDLKFKRKSLNTSMIIRPDGNVRLDCTVPFYIGNVLEKPFSQIWKDKGNTCWQSKDIAYYLNDDKGHVNHYNKDFKI